MRNTMLKKAVSFLVLATMATGSLGGSMVYAANTQEDSRVECENLDASEFKISLYDRLDNEKIKASEKLNADEKEKLVEANDEARVYFDELDVLLDANDKKYDEIMAGTESIYEKMDSIVDQHSNIWEKFEGIEFTDADDEKSEEEIINETSVLNQEEKTLLLSDLKQMNEYEAQLEAKNDEFYQAIKGTDIKFDETYKKIEKIFADKGVSMDGLCDEFITPTNSTN